MRLHSRIPSQAREQLEQRERLGFGEASVGAGDAPAQRNHLSGCRLLRRVGDGSKTPSAIPVRLSVIADLEVGRSFNRPHTSSDNPFSESHFKSLEYHRGFPGKFQNVDDGRYNTSAPSSFLPIDNSAMPSSCCKATDFGKVETPLR